MLSDDPRSPVRSIPAVLRAFLADRRGATAIEYAFLCAMLAAAIVGGGAAMRDGIVDLYGRILTGMPAP